MVILRLLNTSISASVLEMLISRCINRYLLIYFAPCLWHSLSTHPSSWLVLGYLLPETENVFNCSRHQRLVTVVYKFSYLLCGWWRCRVLMHVVAANSALSHFTHPLMKVQPIHAASRQTKLKARRLSGRFTATLSTLYRYLIRLQCFDTVNWVSGRASGL